MVRITVCKDCALSDEKVRRELKRLRLAHGSAIEIKRKDCLDACRKDPAVKVGRKLLAPASPKRIRRAVQRAVDASS